MYDILRTVLRWFTPEPKTCLTFYVFFSISGNGLSKGQFRTYCTVETEDLLLGSPEEWAVAAVVYSALHSGLRRPYHRYYWVQIGDTGTPYPVSEMDLEWVGEDCVRNLLPKIA